MTGSLKWSRAVGLIVACCALVVLNVAACGGDEGPTATGDPAETTQTTVERSTTTEGPSTTAGRPVFNSTYPLRVFLAGDSLMIEVGHAFTRKAQTLTALDLYRINKVSSGFATPEFYDWPKQLRKTVAEFDPVVTVMMFGGNEKVPITLDDGTKLPPFTDEWKAEYVKRVKAGLEIVTGSGSIVYWIGMPNMKSTKFAETARTFNEMFKQICDEDPLVYYIDAYALFSDESGTYAASLPDSSGKMQKVREDDGIHFTAAGGDRVVEAVLEMLSHGFALQ